MVTLKYGKPITAEHVTDASEFYGLSTDSKPTVSLSQSGIKIPNVVVMSSGGLTRRDPVILTNNSRGYKVETGYAEEGYVYVAESASGYPTLAE